MAADVETLAPGPDSGPKFRCFWTTTIILSPGRSRELVGVGGGGRGGNTDFCGSFHSHDHCAFDDGGAGIVDAVKHRLENS